MAATAQAQTEARWIDAIEAPEATGWIGKARAEALARLRASGLPTRRDEYWKYTRPDALTAEATAAEGGADPDVFGGHNSLKVVFTDGVFDADASDDLSAEGLEIDRIDDVGAADIHWARDVFGALEAAGQDPVLRPLAALNTATATEGLLIRATGKVERPVSIFYRTTNPAQDTVLHHIVAVDADASLTVLEAGLPGGRSNTVLEATVAQGGALNHVRSQGPTQDRHVATHVFARLQEEAAFKSFTLSGHGALTRNEMVVEILGDNAITHVAGATIGGQNVHHDDTVFITHDAVGCESRQVFKKVLRGGAVGVFQGKILVRPGAQKTDGYQISQSLLLDDDSQFFAKPELEIYADDVQCSHGSTSGAIDEDALFYLRARGVPLSEAQDLLVLAFLAEAVEEIEDEDIAGLVLDQLSQWLELRRG